MSIGMGVVTHFAEQPMQDDLVVFFQPAEEGPGGALPMLAAEELQDWMPDQMVALHIAPEYPVGTIAAGLKSCSPTLRSCSLISLAKADMRPTRIKRMI